MENLGIDGKLLLAQIINFAIFFIVFYKFMAKPFIKTLEKEKAQDAERDRIMQELATKEQRMKEEEGALRAKIVKERDVMLEKAKKESVSLKQDMVDDAKREAAALVDKGKKQIEAERQTLQDQIKLKTVDLSMYIINNALKQYLTDDTRKSLTSYIIKHLGKQAHYEN